MCVVDVKKEPRSRRHDRALDDYCQYLKGVGPARAVKLAQLGIENVNDLLTHYPRKYYDRRALVPIARLQPGVDSTFVGRVLTSGQRSPRRRRTLVSAAVGDDTGIVQIVWFNQPYLLNHLKPGAEVIVSGQLRTYRGQRQLVNPEFELVGDDLDDSLLSGGRIVPVYPLTAGVTQRYLRQLVRRTLDGYRDAVVENLPSSVTESMDLPPRHEALSTMHFPEDESALERARERIKVEELYYMQLVFSLQRRLRADQPTRFRLDVPFAFERDFVAGLGFELTRAQRRVLDDIHGDLTSDRGMNRLLQGDVGSGKTVVAGATLLSGVEAGYQSAMMVPTEILAAQHFRTLRPHFERLGVRCELLIGGLRAARKREIHAGLADGSIQLVIGTHALIQSDVRFKNLAVVVIDEQHRFGVRQRAALVREGGTPHMLVMTATPIPRTLALTAYADLDLSVIDEMPASRAAVRTRIVQPSKREAMYEYIRDENAQAYLLYPVIEETEKQDLEAAQTAYEDLSKGVFKGLGVGLLHGRMPAADKDRVMRAFAAGDIRVLVATTVVEVGVHVPEATIMAIHHPERFGLSQLHQLRGRVGRGGKEGYCFLVAGEHIAPESAERLEVMVREGDGFRIAEEDLRMRGPGEFLGVRQHGVPGFKVANPLRDGRLVERVNGCVRALLEEDPRLRSSDGRLCRVHLRSILSDDVALRAVV
jgi:ATP-dependent DNA helicase RecG